MSEQEYNLVDKLGITPQEYLIVKEVMVRECVKQGFLKREQALSTLKLDKDRASSVYDFLIQQEQIQERD
jgi:transcriptional adapter 2-alpha